MKEAVQNILRPITENEEAALELLRMIGKWIGVIPFAIIFFIGLYTVFNFINAIIKKKLK